MTGLTLHIPENAIWFGALTASGLCAIRAYVCAVHDLINPIFRAALAAANGAAALVFAFIAAQTWPAAPTWWPP